MTPGARGPWAVVTLAVLLLAAPAGRAQTYSWNLTTGGSWNVAGNWSPATVPNGPGVVATLTGTTVGDLTVTLDNPVSVGSLEFYNTPRTYTVTGSPTLTLDNGAGSAQIRVYSSASGGTQTVAVPLSLLSNLTVTNDRSNSTLTLSGDIALNGKTITTAGTSTGVISFGKITGTGNFTATGGVAVLTSSASDFVGAITLAPGGVLSISSDAQLGAAGNALTFTGGTLRVTGSAPVSTSRGVTLGYINGVTASGVIDVQNTEDGSGFTISSAITGAGPFRKTGPGILTLSAANTNGYTTFVEQGTVRVTAANVLSATSVLSITGGATVKFNGYSQTVYGLTNPTGSGGTLDLGSTAGTVLTINQTSGLTPYPLFTGSIIGTGNVVKTGLATQQMGGSSSYTGTTTVRQGILELTTYVPASGNGPLGNSGGGAVRLGDPAFADLHAVIFNSDKTINGFGRPIDVTAGSGYRTIGHKLSTMADNSYTVTFSGPITLNKDLNLFAKTDVNGNGARFTVSGVVGGAGGLVKIGAGDARLNGDNSYTGATTVLNGRLILGEVGNANAAIRSSSGVVVRSDFSDAAGINLYPGEFIIRIKEAEFWVQDFTPNADRIGDVNVTLSHGWFTYSGRAGGVSSESFGNLVVDRGPNRLTVTTGDTAATTSATLSTTGWFQRTDRGTLVVVGTVIGKPDGQNYARVLAANAPTLLGGGGADGSANISILPWAYHDTDPSGGAATSTETFLTYGPTGLRPLLDTEYVSSLTAPGTLNNVRITSTSTTLTQDQTINALRYGLSANGTINLGGFKLTVNSGAILSTAGTLTFNTGELAFGSAEAIFHSVTSSNGITINSVVSGSGGLTSGITGNLILNGANTYTGPTTINDGGVSFNSAASFGPGGGPIRFRNGFGGSMIYTAAGPTTLPNPIETSPGGTGISVSGGGTLTVNGVISGTSLIPDQFGLTLSGGTGVIQLRGANTFTGRVNINTGTVGIAADNNFGPAANRVGLGSGTTGNPVLRFDAPGLVLNRDLIISGHTAINTNGYNATVSGQVFGSDTTHVLTKTGAGTLTLSGPGTYIGPTTVAAGTLRVNGTLTYFNSGTTVTVASGGTLGGSGTVDRPVTVNDGGGLAPGADVGQLTIRQLAFAANATAVYDWEAGAAAQDRVLVTGGPVNLAGVHLTLKLHDRGLGGSVTPGQQFPLITVAGANSVTGFDPANVVVDFADAPNWAAGQYTLGVGPDGGNTTLYITGLSPAPVPEPATVLALAAAALATARAARRAVTPARATSATSCTA